MEKHAKKIYKLIMKKGNIYYQSRSYFHNQVNYTVKEESRENKISTKHPTMQTIRQQNTDKSLRDNQTKTNPSKTHSNRQIQ